jgi:DNA-binding response OmpR family regulator
MENFRVLLVDDEKEFVSALAERLSLRDFQVETATNGQDALAILKEIRADVVILDVMMPGMSGLEVLKRIKTTHPHLSVILLTGLGSTREGIEGMRLGAFDFLMKPVDIDELIEKMREAKRTMRTG